MDTSPSDPASIGIGSSHALLTVGWREFAALPDWDIRRIKVKIDTGARTSALGVTAYEIRNEGGQTPIAVMSLSLSRTHPERTQTVEAPVLRLVAVRNTSGIYEQRPLIETTLRLGPIVKRIPLTLASRAGMRFRMILGRKALEGAFLVDVSKQYLLKRW